MTSATSEIVDLPVNYAREIIEDGQSLAPNWRNPITVMGSNEAWIQQARSPSWLQQRWCSLEPWDVVSAEGVCLPLGPPG